MSQTQTKLNQNPCLPQTEKPRILYGVNIDEVRKKVIDCMNEVLSALSDIEYTLESMSVNGLIWAYEDLEIALEKIQSVMKDLEVVMKNE